MNGQGAEFVEIFLQEASERLQFLREYSGILQDGYPRQEDVERLHIAAHTLAGTSASYGFPLFAEISGKLAHIFQYALNATIAADAAGPLVEFISEAVALLESDLIMISTNAVESEEDIGVFKQRYPFAFQTSPAPHHQEQPQPGAAGSGAGHAEKSDSVLEESSPVAEIPYQPLPADGEVPAEVLEFFVPEAEEHLQIVTHCLLSLETNPSSEQIHRLLRAMHTVKGSAAQVGLHRIASVAHRAEDLIGRLREGELRPSAEIIDICLDAVDTLKKFLYHQWADEAAMQTSVQGLFSRISRLVPPEKEEDLAVHAVVPAGEVAVPLVAEAIETAPASYLQEIHLSDDEPVVAAPIAVSHQEPAAVPAIPRVAAEMKKPEGIEKFADEDLMRKEPASMPQSKSVRIALERLDRMMNAVGELVINRTRMLGRVAELERLADVLNFSKARMQDKVSEFQEKHEFSRIHAAPTRRPSDDFPLRSGYSSYSHSFDHSLAEFSELEMDRYDDFNILSRSLTEISADITEVLTQLDGFVRRVDGDIDEFTKLAHRLQDEITQARMVPIGNLYTRLSRTVRDAAKAVNKKVELTLAGAETELDNNIIQQISDPLIHLVRNAVAHGLERDEERYEQGKSDSGNVAVRAYHRGNHIYIEVEDDGRGIDYEKVRKTAVDHGMLSAESAAELGERDLLDLLFQPGFSTAPRKTELAGRGVGLDVVKSNLALLNGEIEVETQKGLGSRFTLKVPLTLIISQALFVRCGTSMFALPLSFVEEIRRLRINEIEEVGGKLLTKVRDVVTEIVRLDSVLGLEPIQPINGYFRMVIANVAGRQVGIVVEDVVRKDEIVIKSLGEFLRNLKMFPGATIAPDGSLILLLDVNRLVAGEAIEHRPLMTSANAARVFAPGAAAVAHGAIPQEAIDFVPEEKLVVLVDDSISVRKFVGRMLEKAGYRVKLAADGLEALEIVTQTRCDLVVTDLEMPRTNGYELLSHLRQDAKTRSIPVMVVTSRAGAKHRDRAIKEGAMAFLTKPVQEDQFIAAVSKLIGTPAGQAMEKAAAG
ncbi:MAG: putative Chemotaxis protein CheA modulated with response regulator receiver region (Modular protein) [Candidatus Angelobacter sp.]|nr:putative Chemotaxis protein CheA modulated with response regulator receiver region (Modular protein) [Candidatus Angelobacter sp.]